MDPKNIDKKILDTYYDMWREGQNSESIQKELEMTDKIFDNHAPYFLAYCRQKAGQETREALAAGEAPNVIALTPERRAQFLDLVSTGLSYDKAALLMTVPLVTIFDYWFKLDPMMRQEAKYAAELVDAKITQALVKRAIGYDFQGTSVTEVEGETEKGSFSSTTTTKVDKHVAGDVTAQKFWLINKKPDQFSLDGESNRAGNKGEIMEAIDTLQKGVGEQVSMDELNESFGDGSAE